jgi:hypothetical protein
VRFRAQVQHREQTLLGFEYRRPVRGPRMEPELLPLRWLERLRLPRLCRPQERGPLRGQGFPQPSRGRENGMAGEVRGQKLDARIQKCRRRNTVHGVRCTTARRTMCDARRNEPSYVWGLWFL